MRLVSQSEVDTDLTRHLCRWTTSLAHIAWGPPAVEPRILAARAGWWGMSTDGSSTRVGQYQSLKPAPFWDVDGLLSDGQRTADFYATGLDSETTMTGLRFYGPLFQLDFEYERFLSRLLHDPWTVSLTSRRSSRAVTSMSRKT